MTKRRRPRLEFARDRDRHLLALALAFQALGMSRRGGCEAAVACTEGLPVADNLDRRYGGHGLRMLDWVFKMKSRPGAAATIEGRARGLRQKLKTYLKDAATARWLYQMSNVWLFAIQRAAEPDAARAERQLLVMAELIGETDFVRDKPLLLLRLIRTKRP
jgi:hypothetical protein